MTLPRKLRDAEQEMAANGWKRLCLVTDEPIGAVIMRDTNSGALSSALFVLDKHSYMHLPDGPYLWLWSLAESWRTGRSLSEIAFDNSGISVDIVDERCATISYGKWIATLSLRSRTAVITPIATDKEE